MMAQLVSQTAKNVQEENKITASMQESMRQCKITTVVKTLTRKYEEGRQAPPMFVKIQNGKKMLVAMIDSGAEVNVVGKKLAKSIECQKLEICPLNLCGCGGQ